MQFLSKFLPVILTVVSVGFPAHSLKAVTWIIDEKNCEVYYEEEVHAMISLSCFKQACGARDFVKKIKGVYLKNPPGELAKNPGSPYCKWLNGKVVQGRNSRGSQNDFCQAKDGSLIDLSALGNK